MQLANGGGDDSNDPFHLPTNLAGARIISDGTNNEALRRRCAISLFFVFFSVLHFFFPLSFRFLLPPPYALLYNVAAVDVT